MRFSTEQDPFEHSIKPPRDETPAERALRESQQAEAQRVSDSIDEEIKRERAALKKEKNSVRIMLVGQSDSGKSTTLKNFRLKYARQAWEQERSSWRAVVQLNLLSNVMLIIETLSAEMDNMPLALNEGDEYLVAHMAPIEFTDNHQLLLLRLGPLRQVEADLKQRLGAVSQVPSSASQKAPSRPGSGYRAEFTVKSWGSFFEATTFESSSVEVIAGCREDIKALWSDKTVQRVLKKRRITLQKSGFFIDDVDRIASRTYVPTDDDILQARLRPHGIQEYRLQVNMSTAPGSIRSPAAVSQSLTPDQAPPVGRDFLLYDVGGCRTQRSAWEPFFEGINALLVLVPVDCFDECLEEAPDVNKLQDSFLLWEQLCSSQLLKKATIILFLNKYDLLQEKMNTGIQINRYLTSYSKPNTSKAFVKYLQHKFSDRLQHKSPQPRNSYAYITSVVDSKATSVTLSSVRDSIKRDHLANSSFL